MADDRIWIHCGYCGEKKLVTKHYTGFDLGELFEPGTLEPWIIEHLRHHPRRNCPDLANNPGFTFSTDGR